jgi:hypothetical protein
VADVAILKPNKDDINHLFSKLNGTHIAGLSATLRIKDCLVKEYVGASVVVAMLHKQCLISVKIGV